MTIPTRRGVPLTQVLQFRGDCEIAWIAKVGTQFKAI